MVSLYPMLRASDERGPFNIPAPWLRRVPLALPVFCPGPALVQPVAPKNKDFFACATHLPHKSYWTDGRSYYSRAMIS